MANQYDTNLKLQAIADAIGDSGSSGLIQALEDIADAVAGGGGGGSSAAGLVSDNFSETDTYDLGDYCIHNNTLYVCINAITTPGAWDLSDWQATNAGLELTSLNSAIPTKIGFMDVLSNPIKTIDSQGASWTATQDCWAIARARKNSAGDSNPQVYLQGNSQGTSRAILNVTGVDYAFAVFPIKAGQIVSTRPNVGIYNIEIFGVL